MPTGPDPEEALRIAKAIVDVYADAAATLLAKVARRLARGLAEPGWAERKLLEVAAIRADALAEVERLSVDGETLIDEGIAEAYHAGANRAAVDLGIAATRVRASAAVRQLVAETVTAVQSTHVQILRSTLDIYRSVIAEAGAAPVVTGVEVRRDAAQRVLNRFAQRGVTGFIDSRGRRWDLASYTEMAVRTGAARAHVAGALDRFADAGHDLVIVSDAPEECRACRPWEGKVLSVSGSTSGRLDRGLVVAGTVAEATSAGLFHANCRHSLGVYISGLTKRFEGPTADPEGDRDRQQQRYLERGVRRWKRTEAVALDDNAQQRAAAKRKQWQDRLAAFVDENDRKRLRYREQIGDAR